MKYYTNTNKNIEILRNIMKHFTNINKTMKKIGRTIKYYTNINKTIEHITTSFFFLVELGGRSGRGGSL